MPGPVPPVSSDHVSEGVGTGADLLGELSDEPEVLGGRKSPLRRCIVTGTAGPKDGMLRFVVAPDGSVVPDVEETLPTRGLWLTADPLVVEKAVAKGVFSRAARRAVKVPPDLLARTKDLVRRRCLDLIGLARRGGGAVAGFEKVQAALRSGTVGRRGGVGLWLEARDGAADGRAKLQGLAIARGVPMVALFGRMELGMALGRDEAVHAVLAAGPLTDCLRREAGRLAALEGLGPDHVGPVQGTTTNKSDTE